jgi:hypothetical protein
MPPDLANQFNPSPCQADFTYTIIPGTVKIQDTGKGKKSVADDLRRFCARSNIGTKGRLLVSVSVIGALKELNILSTGTGIWRSPLILRFGRR